MIVVIFVSIVFYISAKQMLKPSAISHRLVCSGFMMLAVVNILSTPANFLSANHHRKLTSAALDLMNLINDHTCDVFQNHVSLFVCVCVLFFNKIK